MNSFRMDDISALSSLLTESRKETNDSTRREAQPPMKTDPVRIKTKDTDVVVGASQSKIGKPIWEEDSIPYEDSIIVNNVTDDRPSPKYEIAYKQMVGTEDTFLGLNNKSPSSDDCSHLVIKVHLPKAVMKDIDLDLTANRIKIESKTHKLFTYLPRNVESEKGVAKFDSKKEILIVTVPIVRDSLL